MDQKELQSQMQRAGLKERDAQKRMIEAVGKAIKQRQLLVIEAPTGTGKTLSYLLGSYLSKEPKQILVISTATIALQEQLINKDLPLLTKILRKQVNYALAKGRRRYVCHARLYQHDAQNDMLNSDQDTLSKLQNLLEKNTWKGDRDQLDFIVQDQTWQTISTDASGCIGKQCAFFDDCAFFKARKQMHSTDIIVANHSLLLSDLELGGGAILPEMEKCIYLIDECHHLPEKALDHFAKSASVMSSVDWINNLTRALTRGLNSGFINDEQKETINEQTHTLVEELKRVRDFLELNQQQFEDDTWRLGEKDITPEIHELARGVLSCAHELYQQLNLLHMHLEDLIQTQSSDSDSSKELATYVAALSFIVNRANNLYLTWQYFCHQRQPGEAPIARWFEKRDTSYYCHTSPINISKELDRLFWKKCDNGVVLCSATVRALGSFKDFQRKAGLKDLDNYNDLALDTCFDYSDSILFIPAMEHAPQGSDQIAHRAEVNKMLPDLILPNSGTLVLFTSKKAMQETMDAMPDELSMDILMQGNRSKAKIIETHKKRIRMGQRSILFGLTSFGEGLDLPADFCQHVIIHKLPFAVPSTPIELTRSEWLEANQRNPFMLATLPATSIRLTQFVGRLIRQETDHGIVTILDKRLYSKNYGNSLVANLPPFRRMINQPVSALKKAMEVEELFA